MVYPRLDNACAASAIVGQTGGRLRLLMLRGEGRRGDDVGTRTSQGSRGVVGGPLLRQSESVHSHLQAEFNGPLAFHSGTKKSPQESVGFGRGAPVHLAS